MNEIYTVAKLGDQILLVNKNDLSYIGKERALEVKCIKVDLHHRTIEPIIELERHLKFNPWEEISEEHRDAILQNIITKFSEREVLEKIVKPLVENLVKS